MVGNLFKALFIALLGGLFSSILLIGFNFSNIPLKTFQYLFWPTAMFTALLGFTGAYTMFAFHKEDPENKHPQRLGAARGFWMALSIILFAMSTKGAYEYIVSPYRMESEIRGITREKNVKRLPTCTGDNCGISYHRNLPVNSKFF